MAAYRGARAFSLPAHALKALGLSSRASLEDARHVHRALARQWHSSSDTRKHEATECTWHRAEQLAIATSARESIELAAKHAVASSSTSSTDIHSSALFGEWEHVLEALSCGANPNVSTPSQGAPPMFFASCCKFLGEHDVGQGDEARLRVLQLFASNPKVDLSMEGSRTWAKGRTIFDLVAMGRCSEPALESLHRGQEIARKVSDRFNFDTPADFGFDGADLDTMASTVDRPFHYDVDFFESSVSFGNHCDDADTMASTMIRRFQYE